MAIFQGKEGPDDAMVNTEGTVVTEGQCCGGSNDPHVVMDDHGTATVDTEGIDVTEGKCCNADKPLKKTFLRLPRELRDEVYKYLLAPAAPGMSICNRTDTAILATNSQIHREASRVLRTYWQPRLVFEMFPTNRTPAQTRIRLAQQLNHVTQLTDSTYPVRTIMSQRAVNEMWTNDPLRITYLSGRVMDMISRAVLKNDLSTDSVIIHYDVHTDLHFLTSDGVPYLPNRGLRDLLRFVQYLSSFKVIIDVHAPGKPKGNLHCKQWANRIREEMNEAGFDVSGLAPGTYVPGWHRDIEVEVRECA